MSYGVRAVGIVAALAVTLGGAAVARAEDAPPAAADDAAEKAREAWREGLALMAAENWAGALAKFKTTARFRMTAQVAFNIAECEAHIGQLVSALGNYRLALGKAQDGSAESVTKAAPDRIAAIEPRIAKLTIKRSEEKPNPRASIELDGVVLGASQIATPLAADPGERTLRVMVGGNAVATQRVRLGEGEAKEVSVAIPPPEEIKAPPTAPAVSAGPNVPGIVLVSVGGAALVGGAVFLGLRQSAISELDDLCGGDTSCPPSAQDTYDRGRLMTGLSEVFIPVGAVAAVAGIVLVVVNPGGGPAPATETAAFTLAPTAPDGAGPGLSLSLRY